MTDTTTSDTDPDESSPDEMSRRQVLAAAAGAAAVGAAGYVTGTETATAQSAPAGQIGTLSDPLLVAYVDHIVFNPRTSDPSSPSDGMAWYNSEA